MLPSRSEWRYLLTIPVGRHMYSNFPLALYYLNLVNVMRVLTDHTSCVACIISFTVCIVTYIPMICTHVTQNKQYHTLYLRSHALLSMHFCCGPSAVTALNMLS